MEEEKNEIEELTEPEPREVAASVPVEPEKEVTPIRVAEARNGKLNIIKRLRWPVELGPDIIHGKNIIFEDSYGIDWAVLLSEGSLISREEEHSDDDRYNQNAGHQQGFRRDVRGGNDIENDNDLTDEEKNEIAVRTLEGKVVRYCDEEDEANIEHLAELEAEAMDICIDRVKSHSLPMKLLATDYRYDRSKVTFHFSAENRVDFRQLVRDLASIFKCRIELHQIGIRDEAKLYPGCGPCGQKLCCQRHLTKFESVSIRMARIQNLPLNPSKISGNCGRLMCCLNYECDTYAELAEILPNVGEERDIDGKRCTVIFVSPLTETITMDVNDEVNKKFTITREEFESGSKVKGKSDKS